MRRKLKKLRLRPIRVFLFHQVSDVFDQDTMKICDWTETQLFKKNIGMLKKKYLFVSLEIAYQKMSKDVFRFRNYAVLTSDDGWASLSNVLPWLAQQNVPVTLFLNPGYFDGQHFRDIDTEQYLLEADIQQIADNYPNVTFGTHGWEHKRATEQNETQFRESVSNSLKVLQVYPNFIPYFAYTYGGFNAMTGRILKDYGLVPVLIDGMKNWDDLSCIHRELLDGNKF